MALPGAKAGGPIYERIATTSQARVQSHIERLCKGVHGITVVAAEDRVVRQAALALQFVRDKYALKFGQILIGARSGQKTDVSVPEGRMVGRKRKRESAQACWAARGAAHVAERCYEGEGTRRSSM